MFFCKDTTECISNLTAFHLKNILKYIVKIHSKIYTKKKK